ncbi:ABC transporter substrate-binding protein [Butyrivibrio sp. WCD3002]|jgi:multiple sugar transport system substrate-binding protein|uniref:ABC transporter substrate-binding protein n=1 Tax=Butyrivibrio sp. WCD3002 TaxID=1280676 RepID=UPI000414B874|nr:extracellular solute-binding protein [Butyrivibrio sp. WCD3002]
MKRELIAYALGTAILAGALTGCGASNAGSAGANDEASVLGAKTGTVELWNDKLNNTDQSAIDELTESASSLSGVNVSCVAYPDTASYQTALQQSITTADAPGLFTWWSGPQLMTLAESGNLADLTDIWNEYVVPNGVADSVKDSLTYDGKIYAVPYSIIYNMIIYNKNVFAENKIDVPTTFDELLAVCETLKSKGITPIALKNDSWAGFIWFQAMLAAYDPNLYQGVCDGSIAYTDDKVVEVMHIWQDMIDKGYFSEPMQITDMDKSLANGTVAMMLEPNYECKNLTNDYGMEPEEDMSVFVVPSMNGEKSIIFYEIAPLCVAENSGDKDSAKEVLKSWYTKENQTVFTNVTGFLCTSQVVSENATSNQMVSLTQDDSKYEMMLRYYENTNDAIRDVALDELMKFETKAATADDILPVIQKKADEVFGQ